MPGYRLPESCSRLTPLYRGALFAVEDWCCAGSDTAREEWSSEDRVVMTRRGTWELEVAGQTRRADPTMVTFWKRAAPFRVRHPVPGGDRCTVFRLTQKGSEQLSEAAGKPFTTYSCPVNGRTYLAHRRTLERARRNPDYQDPLAVEESGLGFLGLLTGAGSGPVGKSAGDRRYIERTRDIIAREFRTPLRLTSIATAVGCSPFHLSRLFHAATGTSLYRAVVILRLREALERLLDGEGTLSSIALEVGFASHSHLTDAFRAEYGCAPSEARRVIRGQGS